VAKPPILSFQLTCPNCRRLDRSSVVCFLQRGRAGWPVGWPGWRWAAERSLRSLVFDVGGRGCRHIFLGWEAPVAGFDAPV
jgi:hypothetical protein